MWMTVDKTVYLLTGYPHVDAFIHTVPTYFLT
ncbi:hypothetical protein LALCM10_10002 [Dellaglioa algida]|nr:hypothetical protein LALCM10_10002 [Dellaglioa algida]